MEFDLSEVFYQRFEDLVEVKIPESPGGPLETSETARAGDQACGDSDKRPLPFSSKVTVSFTVYFVPL